MIGITFVAYMAAMVPLFPGGAGGFEAVLSGLFVSAGYGLSDALAIAVVFRFISFWLVMLFRVLFITIIKARRMALKRRTE